MSPTILNIADLRAAARKRLPNAVFDFLDRTADEGTIRALPGIVEAVKDKTSIFLDSGIRRGGDILKALCLGADAVLVGRAYAYGLAAAGDAGVDRALEILRADMIRTMKLLGVLSIKDLHPGLIAMKPGFRVD